MRQTHILFRGWAVVDQAGLVAPNADDVRASRQDARWLCDTRKSVHYPSEPNASWRVVRVRVEVV